MSETISSRPAPQTAAEYEAAIEDVLTEIRRSNERMARHRTRIERLKAETAAIAEHTDGVLAEIEARLRALSAAK